jgi:hypothetical protein
LPAIEDNLPWQRLIDTYDADSAEDDFPEGTAYELRPCSMAVFRMAVAGGQG